MTHSDDAPPEHERQFGAGPSLEGTLPRRRLTPLLLKRIGIALASLIVLGAVLAFALHHSVYSTHTEGTQLSTAELQQLVREKSDVLDAIREAALIEQDVTRAQRLARSIGAIDVESSPLSEAAYSGYVRLEFYRVWNLSGTSSLLLEWHAPGSEIGACVDWKDCGSGWWQRDR